MALVQFSENGWYGVVLARLSAGRDTEIGMLLLLAMIGFAVAVLISLGEAIYERDWPRETFKYVVMFGIVVLMCLGR